MWYTKDPGSYPAQRGRGLTAQRGTNMIDEKKMRAFIQEQIDSYSKLIADAEQDRANGKCSDAFAESVAETATASRNAMRLFLQFYDQRVELGLLGED